jgi:heme/copper-type cytochrome/quinol oxidase subunit 2
MKKIASLLVAIFATLGASAVTVDQTALGTAATEVLTVADATFATLLPIMIGVTIVFVVFRLVKRFIRGTA